MEQFILDYSKITNKTTIFDTFDLARRNAVDDFLLNMISELKNSDQTILDSSAIMNIIILSKAPAKAVLCRDLVPFSLLGSHREQTAFSQCSTC